MSSVLQRGRLPTTRKDVTRFVSSLQQDQRIAKSTVFVNEAHVIALAKARIIGQKEAKRLINALAEIEDHIPRVKKVEDVHVLIEQYVTGRVGNEVGGKLHTGKSRNDQVTTAIRMTLRESMLELSDAIVRLGDELHKLANKHRKTLFVGYTHLQPAQPTTFAHYVLAIVDALLRNNQRLMEAYSRVNTSPMGGGALAGSSFPLDRLLVARLLGFNGLVENSLDAVSSRDFILESLSVCAIIASDMSRVAEDLIFYGSSDVGLVELPDRFSSTSTMMPQKKNPDPLELVRAKGALVGGNLSSALALMHALPSGYNLDFQELTPLLWNSLDSISSSLHLLASLFPQIKVEGEVARRETTRFTVATEVANVLVRDEGVPFREAHRMVGKAVSAAIEKHQSLRDNIGQWSLTLGRKLKDLTLQDLERALEPAENPALYLTRGSPNPEAVARMVRNAGKRLEDSRESYHKERARLDGVAPALHRTL